MERTSALLSLLLAVLSVQAQMFEENLNLTTATEMSTVTLSENITLFPNMTEATTSPSNSTMIPHDNSTTDGTGTGGTKPPSSPVTLTPTEETTATTTTQKPAPPTKSSHSTTVLTVFLIIIGAIFVAVLACCCVKRNSRRYSLDLRPRQEDAQVPLSAVDQDVFETTSAKDMKSFAAETSVSPPNPAPDTGTGEPEGENDITGAGMEKDALTNSQDRLVPEGKANELAVVDLNDGDLGTSTKTSVESLDEPLNEPLNENNSNSTARAKGCVFRGSFTEINLDDLL